MESISYIFMGSLAALVFLTVLFRFEDRKGRRLFLRRPRAFIDSGMRFVGELIEKIFTYIGQGAVRQTSHVLLHKLLFVLLRGISYLEAALMHIQHKNRKIARRNTATPDSRMTEISNHAAAIKMTPEEARQKRHEMLES